MKNPGKPQALPETTTAGPQARMFRTGSPAFGGLTGHTDGLTGLSQAHRPRHMAHRPSQGTGLTGHSLAYLHWTDLKIDF